MNVLVLDAGQSSLRCAVLDSTQGRLLHQAAYGGLDRVDACLGELPSLLERDGAGDIEAIAYRVRHGGDVFANACVLDTDAVAAIGRCGEQAASYNGDALACMRTGRTLWPTRPHVAVFDTVFLQDLTSFAVACQFPEAWRDAALRRFGAHDLARMAQAAAHLLADTPPGARRASTASPFAGPNRPPLRLVATCAAS